MSNNIVLKRGLDLPVNGAAALKTSKTVAADVVAIKPTDFRGCTLRLLVREGDKVLAGSPVLADKKCPDIIFASPVSGTVAEIVRGDRRKLLAVLIKADAQNEAIDFGKKNVAGMKAEEIKEQLLKSGVWPFIVQRPYGILADPTVQPKAIFISAFSTAPLAADLEYTLGAEVENIQTAVDALAKLTAGGVHVCTNSASSKFSALKGVKAHVVEGKHPAGNVGVQISHISPIVKGDTVWTVSLQGAAAIGKLLNTGKLDLARKIAVTGPRANDPAYVEALPGTPMSEFACFAAQGESDIRWVSGDVLSGTAVGADGYLGFFDNQVTLLSEGNYYEMLGWAKPARPKLHSFARTYFSWLCPKKKYDMDTNTHGGVRPFVLSDVYSKVLPMDIYPVYLCKACLTNNIDDMEKFGIYEVLPEDLALCEYVDPSKIEIQSIIADGIALMLKEMA